MKNSELIKKLQSMPMDEDVNIMVFQGGEEYWAPADEVEYHPEEIENECKHAIDQIVKIDNHEE